MKKEDNNENTQQSKSTLEILTGIILLIIIIFVAIATYISVHSATIIQNYEPDTFLYNISILLTPIFVPLIVLNIVIIIILIFSKRFLWLIIPCLAIVINWNIIPNIIQIRAIPKPDQLANAITLQSYNVHKFTYNSFGNTVDNILFSASINKTDILCLQEYTIYNDEANSQEYATIDERIRKNNNLHQDEAPTNNSNIGSISQTFPYSCYSNEKSKVGIALFSKYPIIQSQTYDFPNSDQEALIADIEINTTKMRVITVHLHTTTISQHNTEMSILTDGLVAADASYKLSALSRLTQAFVESSSTRRNQADIISNLIKESPYPVIVCGDFNDTPNSYSYYKFEQLLSDAFKTSGSGYGYSYIPLLHSLRIDYIFHSNKITPIQFYYKPYPWSDHSAAFFKFHTPTKIIVHHQPKIHHLSLAL